MSSPLGIFSDYFAYFGVVAASYIALKLLSSLLSGLKNFIVGGGVNLKKYGEWAVVTGATDGIGKAYAQELAKQGLNIVLISRSAEKLSDVADEIVSQSKVKTKTVPIDFTGSADIYDTIQKELTNLDIGVLVNNVGMSYEHPEFYCEVRGGDKKIQDILKVNIQSVTGLTSIVLPKMVEKRKGVIINISSASAIRPTPLLTTYSATKAFVDYFSRGLQTEYGPKGIIVQSVKPFFVATKLSGIKRTSFMAPGPNQYVKAALATVGSQDETYGCLAHALQGWVVERLPSSVYNKVTMSQMLAVRKKAIKRMESKKE